MSSPSFIPTTAPTSHLVNHVVVVAGIASVCLVTLSIISEFLTVLLIHDIGRWNGYMRIIYAMSLCLVAYDVTFYCVLVNLLTDDAFSMKISSFLSTTFGIAVALWTNVITCIVMHVVYHLHSVNVQAHFWKYSTGIMSFSIIFGSFYSVYQKELLIPYNAMILASIALNIFGYVRIVRKLEAMGDASSKIMEPVQVLASRIRFYPIIQFVTRLMTSIYELRYGSELQNITGVQNVKQKVLLCIASTTLPLTGLGFFIIFLNMQPLAQERLYASLWGLISCRRPRDGSEEQQSASVQKIEDAESQTKKDSGDKPREGKKGVSFHLSIATINMDKGRSETQGSIKYVDEDELSETIDQIATARKAPRTSGDDTYESTTNAMWMECMSTSRKSSGRDSNLSEDARIEQILKTSSLGSVF